MAINKDRAKSVLADGGVPWLPEELAGTKKIKDNLQADTRYKLGRIGVVKETLQYKQPFVALELNGEIYTGYGTALGNQITRLIEDEIAAGNTVGMVNNNRNAYTEDIADIEVYFVKRNSPAGEYWLMLID